MDMTMISTNKVNNQAYTCLFLNIVENPKAISVAQSTVDYSQLSPYGLLVIADSN